MLTTIIDLEAMVLQVKESGSDFLLITTNTNEEGEFIGGEELLQKIKSNINNIKECNYIKNSDALKIIMYSGLEYKIEIA